MNSKKAKALRRAARGMTLIQGRSYDAIEHRKPGSNEVTRTATNNQRTMRGIYRRLKRECYAELMQSK